MLYTDDCILLIIDIQEKLLNAVYNSKRLENRALILTQSAAILNIPTFITEQYPKGLGGTIQSIKNLINDNVPIAEKTGFDAFADEQLFKRFEAYNRSQVIICGIETHICVYQTAYHLLKEGFEVTVVNDSCGSRNEFDHNTALQNLSKADNCCIKSTEMVIFELLKSSRHSKFKEIQNLIK